jgi:methyltransferase-like protein
MASFSAQKEVLNIYNQTNRIYQNLIETRAYMEYKIKKKTRRIWSYQAQQPQ